MDVQARMTSKGQITVPKAVRDALGLGEGDAVLFRVEEDRVQVIRTPSLEQTAGSIPVPPTKRNASWDEILRATATARAQEWRG